MRSPGAALLAMLLWPAVGGAGVFLGTTHCTPTVGCLTGRPASDDSQVVNPFGVTHPRTFAQMGTTTPVRVCVESTPGAPLYEVTAWAIEKWNALAARTENCSRCAAIEEPFTPTDPVFPPALSDVILHELGHCALGLDHVNRLWDVDGDGQHDQTSFTLSHSVFYPTGLKVGPDQIRGSLDDEHLAPFGQLGASVHWFRRSDNDPVIVEPLTPVDIFTYSRDIEGETLPAGHSWAANANRVVASTLGHNGTQAVMYSALREGSIYHGLTADDVSMVKLARTGEDTQIGGEMTTPHPSYSFPAWTPTT